MNTIRLMLLGAVVACVSVVPASAMGAGPRGERVTSPQAGVRGEHVSRPHVRPVEERATQTCLQSRGRAQRAVQPIRVLPAPRTVITTAPVSLPGVAHPDMPPEESDVGAAGSTGDGVNDLSFTKLGVGDLVVCLGSGVGHAGMFDRSKYRGLDSRAMLSANKKPVSAVQYETCAKYRASDRAYGLAYSKATNTLRYKARRYAVAQLGEPYDIMSSKGNQDRWYCSKLCWAAWRSAAQVDLDGDGGYWVWPVDLLSDPQTTVVASGA